MRLPLLLDEVSHAHFPNPPATSAQIEAFEQRMGWKLDADLRAFYLHCDGASLFDLVNSPFIFPALAKWVRARKFIFGEDLDEGGPDTWFVVCEVLDGNCIILDVSQQENGRSPIRDGYREGFPDPKWCPRIAGSFSEFLAGALQSKGRWFWLGADEQT
ncbi:SMI1/KNR4 family protein [Corallococcus llansteffanensis]|uniref:SMI1/KNR4 family protein n=2 Tax=Corallococcus llansteffanensis TaxID=2316731 RepID=A0A3A8N972_9BACT|nr:SMI1/KNR4 family protein [Corallococcus llansteffanensis]RKH40836.1 SMI1/KNR4 family protein [Corallococcus llansteffanensis]